MPEVNELDGGNRLGAKFVLAVGVTVHALQAQEHIVQTGEPGQQGMVLKDESVRSDLGSFKALGAPIALARLILRLCGETSPLAWRFLVSGADYFMTTSDDDAVAAMRVLAIGNEWDIPIVSGI